LDTPSLVPVMVMNEVMDSDKIFAGPPFYYVLFISLFILFTLTLTLRTLLSLVWKAEERGICI